jgi:protein-disulfide isomerase
MRAPTALVLSFLASVMVGCASGPGAGAPAAQEPANPFNVLGRADAPVSIIEFSDLQCPFCARFALDTFPQIRRNYIDTGKVRYAAKDFPLPFHVFAVPAAVAVRCAGEQGKFWEYREALFARQAELPSQPYDALAGELKLDLPRFTTCRGDGKAQAAIREEVEAARASGISGTPTFAIGRLVNGQFQGETFSGAEPYEKFAARIESQLAAPK